jgi:hypothetical protein
MSLPLFLLRNQQRTGIGVLKKRWRVPMKPPTRATEREASTGRSEVDFVEAIEGRRGLIGVS